MKQYETDRRKWGYVKGKKGPFPPSPRKTFMSKRSWEEKGKWKTNEGKLNIYYTSANTYFIESDADDDPDKGEPIDFAETSAPAPVSKKSKKMKEVIYYYSIFNVYL